MRPSGKKNICPEIERLINLRVVTLLDASIASHLGSAVWDSRPIGGGCIHDARCVDLADGRRIFVKSASGDRSQLLLAELRGLETLSPHIRTPEILSSGRTDDGTQWLALEWLDLLPLTSTSWSDLGTQLASLHSVTSAQHGLEHDNFIGATPQSNDAATNWSDFYCTRRLQPQLQLAYQRGHQLPEAQILQHSERLLKDHDPRPALLHGDLWSGNTAAIFDARAVVFDPAPYFGDPETDLAMLELFGSPLPEPFLESYRAISPERLKRRPLYELYHALNHLNLFGSGYLPMVQGCLDLLIR